MLVVSFFAPYSGWVALSGTAAVFPGIAAMPRRWCWRCAGINAARILLLAWGMLLLGTTVYAISFFGVLSKMFLTEYGMQIEFGF